MRNKRNSSDLHIEKESEPQGELVVVNTTETLGVTPRYVLQHNAISRSAHSFSALARKVTAMAMSLLPPDLSSLSAAFNFPEFCHALGLERGGNNFELFRAAVKECLDKSVYIEIPAKKKGKTNFVGHHWFSRTEINEDTCICTMDFDPELADFLKAMKWMYSKIILTDIGLLQSRYAIRIYEFAISYSSLKGRDGNATNEWYFERTIPELRKIFGIGPDEYKKTNDFKVNVIERPINEINNAGMGIKITLVDVRDGRSLIAIRFVCEKAISTTASKKTRQGKQATAQLPLPVSEEYEREEKELAHLRELYPDEFAALYEIELTKISKIFPERTRLLAAEGAALAALKERHGIVK